MAELNESEDILMQIKEGVRKDMRSVESEYLRRRALIRSKYAPDGSSGFINSLKGPFGKTRVKELKDLENERKNSIESYHEIRYMVEDLLVQIDEIKNSVKNMMREMLGNY